MPGANTRRLIGFMNFSTAASQTLAAKAVGSVRKKRRTTKKKTRSTSTTRRRKKTTTRKKKTKAQIDAERLKNLAKARRARKKKARSRKRG